MSAVQDGPLEQLSSAMVVYMKHVPLGYALGALEGRVPVDIQTFWPVCVHTIRLVIMSNPKPYRVTYQSARASSLDRDCRRRIAEL